jgi:hypothetical protein
MMLAFRMISNPSDLSGDCDPNTGNDGMRTLLRMLQDGPNCGKKLLHLIIPRCNIG